MPLQTTRQQPAAEHGSPSPQAAAAAVAVANPPQPCPGLSTVEAAVPGSFCAELWRRVSQPGGIFRCAQQDVQ